MYNKSGDFRITIWASVLKNISSSKCSYSNHCWVREYKRIIRIMKRVTLDWSNRKANKMVDVDSLTLP